MKVLVFCLVLISFVACSSVSTEFYRDQNMDFGAVEVVAVMPFSNSKPETIFCLAHRLR